MRQLISSAEEEGRPIWPTGMADGGVTARRTLCLRRKRSQVIAARVSLVTTRFT